MNGTVPAPAGLHHVTVMSRDPQENFDFHTQVLGQRLVKTTINFDAPDTYHLYYGDGLGNPGTIVTFFPWEHLPPGRSGAGDIATLRYAVAPDSVAYWFARLEDHGCAVERIDSRFGHAVLRFRDPHGLRIELEASPEAPVRSPWNHSPVPVEHQLRGFSGITLWVTAAEEMERFLTQAFSFRPVGEQRDPQGRRHRFRGSSSDGSTVDLVEDPDLPQGSMGAGSIHHVAFRAPDAEVQKTWRTALLRMGVGVTPVKDRQYFQSIYFQSPAGALFEIATDPPGFAIDEDPAVLGSSLKLPAWYEDRRLEIEAGLPALDRRRVSHA